MERKETNINDKRTKYTRKVIQQAFMELLKEKPYTKINVTDLCRRCDINRGTFYIHYYDIDDLLDDIIENYFSDVSSTIDHVLCFNNQTCSYPFCRKIQENPNLWPLFMDDTVSDRIVGRLTQRMKESYIGYLTSHSTLSIEQAESIFSFQISGCMAVNRIMIKKGGKNWQTLQETIDRFLRGGFEEFVQ